MKNRLKNKILLISTLFSIILLVSLIVFFYVSGSQFIENESMVAADKSADIFHRILYEELINAELEITTIKKFSNLSELIESAPLGEYRSDIDQIKTFMLGNPFKYSGLYLSRYGWKYVLSFRPVKVFSGQFLIEIAWKEKVNFPDSLKKYFNGHLFSDTNPHIEIWDNKSRSIYLIEHSISDSVGIICADLSMDYLFDKVIHSTNTLPGIEPVIADSSGRILFSANTNLLNKNLSTAFTDYELSFDLDESSSGPISSGHYFISRRELGKGGMFLIVVKNSGEEFERLNRSLLLSVLFSIVLFGFLMMIIYALTKRLSGSLNKVINVANKVAEGDLSHKIEFHSSDEIGILINTFNEMVDKLRINYESLNLVNKKLEEKIQELIKTKSELSKKEKLALIGETISKISHEMQNKVSGISIWVQNLEMQVREETLKIYITEMKSALKSFLEMLTDFKKFYRQPKLDKSTVHIPELIDAIVGNCRQEIRSKQLDVKIQTDQDLPLLFVDRRMIEEALLNVLINAIQFSPAGGELIISCSPNENEISVSFKDDGPGIKDEYRDRIFQPFFTTNPSGSGLGLAIVSNIINAHGGAVNFHRGESGGTVFVIRLPLEFDDNQTEKL